MNIEHCHLCQKKEDQPKVFFQIDGAIFFQCRHCGLVWLEKDKWFVNQQAYYSEQYYPENYSGRKNLKDLFRYRFKLIKKYFKPEGRILEVGAASGDFLHLLQDVGYEVYGVEISKRAAEQASLNYHVTLSQGTLEEASFPADFFDYIVMYHVLEHIPDPLATLQEAYRVLKPNGRILIEVPNVRSVDTYSRSLLLNVLDYPNRIYAFSPENLKKIVIGAGFRTILTENSFPFSLAQWFTKMRRLFKSEESPVKVASNEIISGKDLFKQAKEDFFFKRYVQQIMPGMKTTLIGEK